MAEFSIRILKKGFEGRNIKTIVAITDIYFDDTDKEVIIPKEYEGMPITHILYHQEKIDEYAKFHDWHHPAQGYDEIVPAEYYIKANSYFYIPSNVKKIVFPNTLKCINIELLNNTTRRKIYKLEEENEYYEINEKGKFCYKSNQE